MSRATRRSITTAPSRCRTRSIKLIPPAPDAFTLASELAGVRAPQAFEKSIKNAAESVTIIADGTNKSYELFKDIQGISKDAADAIDHSMTEGGKTLVYKSSELGKSIGGRSWDTSKDLIRSDAGLTVVQASRAGGNKIVAGAAAAGEQIAAESSSGGKKIAKGSVSGGKEIISDGVAAGDKIVSGSIDLAKDLSADSIDRSGKALDYGGTRFVKGYAAVPKDVKRRIERTGTNIRGLSLIDILGEENKWRKEWSQKTVDLLGGTISGYGTDATSSFKKAGKELGENYRTQGVSLSVLKSIRWVLQGVLWDATVEPLAKTTGAALGYLSVNMLAFPTVVLVKEGVATTHLAVQVTLDTAKTGYDVVAPTAIAAVAGVYAAADMAASHTAAAATAVAGPVAGYTTEGLSAVAGVTVISGGYVAGKSVEGGGYVAGEVGRGRRVCRREDGQGRRICGRENGPVRRGPAGERGDHGGRGRDRHGRGRHGRRDRRHGSRDRRGRLSGDQRLRQRHRRDNACGRDRRVHRGRRGVRRLRTVQGRGRSRGIRAGQWVGPELRDYCRSSAPISSSVSPIAPIWSCRSRDRGGSCMR